MPTRRSNENWFETQCPNTPLQKKEFLEMCTRWLVREPDEGISKSFDEKVRSIPPDFPLLRSENPQSCFTEFETRHLKQKKCIVCDSTKNVDVVLANPFAIRCYVGVCVSCSSE